MHVGSLFAGIGGADFALEALGCETVWHSEVEPYAGEVFAQRFPNSIALGDIRGIGAEVPAVDVLVGGFPCQDISAAGRGAGIAPGTRSGLWSEYARLVGELRPRLVLIENVSMLPGRGLGVVLADLERLEYAVEWDCIPAAAVGAPHLRDRIWMVAYPEDSGPLDVFTDRPEVERAVGTLHYPPSKFPRAGRMEQGAVYERQPVAPRKTKRLNPGSAWVGARLADESGWWHEARLYPSPTAGLGDGGQVYGPDYCDMGGREGRRREGPGHLGALRRPGCPARRESETSQLGTVAARGLWLTPTASPWDHGGGGGELQAEVNARQEAEGKPRGSLNPDWVDWLMGFPVGWTDLDVETPVFHSWDDEPRDVPRVSEGVPKRRERLTCDGNALVPQVMRWVAGRALAVIA